MDRVGSEGVNGLARVLALVSEGDRKVIGFIIGRRCGRGRDPEFAVLWRRTKR